MLQGFANSKKWRGRWKEKSCWLRFWALILRWVTLKTCGCPLIIKRDGLLVSACERLASCPAGFTCRPKYFTSKTHEIHHRHEPADLERSSETYTCANPHSHLLCSFFIYFVCLCWWNLAVVDVSPFSFGDIMEEFLATISHPFKSRMGFLHICSLRKINSTDRST